MRPFFYLSTIPFVAEAPPSVPFFSESFSRSIALPHRCRKISESRDPMNPPLQLSATLVFFSLIVFQHSSGPLPEKKYFLPLRGKPLGQQPIPGRSDLNRLLIPGVDVNLFADDGVFYGIS